MPALTQPYEYLVVATTEQEIEGYYLLTDRQMERADNHNDYWEFLAKRKGCGRCFSSISDLARFMGRHNVVLKGEFSATAY